MCFEGTFYNKLFIIYVLTYVCTCMYLSSHAKMLGISIILDGHVYIHMYMYTSIMCVCMCTSISTVVGDYNVSLYVHNVLIYIPSSEVMQLSAGQSLTR